MDWSEPYRRCALPRLIYICHVDLNKADLKFITTKPVLELVIY